MTATLITLGVFALILVLARLKIPLTLAVLSGTVVAGFLYGMGPGKVALNLGAGVIQPRTVALGIIVVLILMISGLMDKTGQLEQIVSLAKQLLRRPAVAMAALPALIGLLPMPGGALFSAPMVKSAAGEGTASGARLSAINYWYRHIWEHYWPLYPGVILTLSLTEFSYASFALRQWPLGLFMVCTGLLLFRKMHPDLATKSARPAAGTKRKLVAATSSIWLILIVWLPVSLLLKITAGELSSTMARTLSRYLPLGAGLVFSIIVTVMTNKLGKAEVLSLFKRKSPYALAVLVISVMVFQYMLESAGAAERIADELLAVKIPVVAVVAALPFIAGFVTGLAIGFVGTSFPIVLALVAAMPDAGSLHAYVALAYGFGHLGQMVSPIHLCHIVSNQYFETPFSRVYPRLLPTLILNAILVAGYFILLRAIG